MTTSWPKHLPAWLFLLLAIGAAILALSSVYWVSGAVGVAPSRVAVVLAGIATLVAISVVAWILTHPIPAGLETYGTFLDALDAFPDHQGVFEALRKSVREGKLKPRSPLCRSHIEELRHELRDLARVYVQLRYRGIIRSFLGKSGLTILVFAALFMADYTLEVELTQDRKPGFSGLIGPDGSMVERLVEAIYFSSVIFVTIGDETIQPDGSAWARILVVCEACTFLVLITFGFSSTLTAIQLIPPVDPNRWIEALEDMLEREDLP